MQSAVCVLTCNLGAITQCHNAVPSPAMSSSKDTSMAGMPHMHCSGMNGRHASKGMATSVQTDARDGGLCSHPSPLAMIGSIAQRDAVTTIRWVVVEPVLTQTSTSSFRFAASSKAPPPLPPVDLLHVTLRV